MISITDHDSIDTYYELENNPNIRSLYSGQIIIGSELKTHFKEVSIEVLAYGCDFKKLQIHKVDTKKAQEENLKKFKNVMDREGFKYNMEELYIDINNPSKRYGAYVAGKEILNHPENEELIKKFGEFIPETFFRVHQCNKNSIFYINECEMYPNLNEVISDIHEAGGLAFLAHGFIYPYENPTETIEEILRTTQIDGIECEYPLFTNEQRKIAKYLCIKYNKFMSGGSDYHAKTKPTVKLGTGIQNNINISKELIKDWIDKVRKV